ncbi:MAG: signal recognition particle-docking protein FtsY [Rhodospirillaceae bacterium]|jgi:fused signal recognition particle receptor|nr:signal recognition particle-docking protein FtsY [Rhodospirillaceae bacterium]MBT5298998.1 signal recognition particle-docking protein FtsY [Rhodospirillaceae bacterium]MBT6883445.1 signal recognition particle-docking protein FtsY [Rhodospirillaceae bacterium]MBT7512459.1 signal recognition particle-docking protein FtsY [Rhodospirillaceae bacterium]
MSDDAGGNGGGGWLGRLKSGLSRSSEKITGSITGLFTKRKLDAAALQDLEDALIAGDLGVATATRLAGSLSDQRFDQEITPDEVRALLADDITKILEPVARPLDIDVNRKPFVILVCGVNGSGKTTTIGKLAGQFRDQGKSVIIAAADTFRAAAVEQLQVWGERAGAEVISGQPGADAAGLAFGALEKARAGGADILMIDTAGRLQNRKDLMAELEKIVRVIAKLDDSAPHATLLVMDATIGQNAHSQVETFKQMINVSGLVMTKLDGSAKGGVVVALAEKFGLPVHAVGVGEGIDDLRPFEACAFARSLMGLDA